MMSDQHRNNKNGEEDEHPSFVITSFSQELVVLKIAVIALIASSIFLVLIVPTENLLPLMIVMWVGLAAAFSGVLFCARRTSHGITYTLSESKIILSRGHFHKVILINSITKIKCYKLAIVIQYNNYRSNERVCLFLGKERKEVATFMSQEWGVVIDDCFRVSPN